MNTTEIYQTPNGEIAFRGDLEHETIWANQKQLATSNPNEKEILIKLIKHLIFE